MTVQYLRALHSADFPRGREKGEWAETLRIHTASLCGKMFGEFLFADSIFIFKNDWVVFYLLEVSYC